MDPSSSPCATSMNPVFIALYFRLNSQHCPSIMVAHDLYLRWCLSPEKKAVCSSTHWKIQFHLTIPRINQTKFPQLCREWISFMVKLTLCNFGHSGSVNQNNHRRLSLMMSWSSVGSWELLFSPHQQTSSQITFTNEVIYQSFIYVRLHY